MPNSNSPSEFAPNADRETNSPLDIYTGRKGGKRAGESAAGIFTKEEEIIRTLEGGERLERDSAIMHPKSATGKNFRVFSTYL